MKKTPLYEKHLDFNAKMTDFGGWLLPLEYTGIIEEHKQVRNAAGLFDVSHMGKSSSGVERGSLPAATSHQ